MTLKKPVLLLYSENMITLDMVYYCSITAKNENEIRNLENAKKAMALTEYENRITVKR